MGFPEISMIAVLTSALGAAAYDWYDTRLRKHCLRRISNWQNHSVNGCHSEPPVKSTFNVM